MLLSQQKSREREAEVESRLRVVGHCPMRMLQDAGGDQMRVHELLERAFVKQKKQYTFHPVKVFTTANCLAAIDNKVKLWALIDLIGQPICLSDMLRLKVHDLALHHTQMILSTSAGRLLLSWGGRKYFPDKHLSKISIRNAKFKYSHYFELHEISKEAAWYDRYYFTHGQKITEDSIVYQLTNENKSLLLHPSSARIDFKLKLAGVSLGTYHNLAWDWEGKLYSWGCRSIALGYLALPDEEVVRQPRVVEQVRGHVIKAYAGCNHSLAVTLDGKLFEWGINKLHPNKEQIIFEPREIPTPCQNKLVDLKGCCDRFAVLSLTGELYIWGKNAKQLLGDPSARSIEDNTITMPTLLDRKSEFIVDFQVEESCVLLITANRTVQAFSDSRKAYWASLKESIQLNLKGTIPSKGRLSSNEAQVRLDSVISHSALRRFTDPIELAFERRRAKENYLASALEPDRTLNYLMQPSERSHYASAIATEGQLQREKRPSLGKSVGRRLVTAMQELSSDFRREREYVQALVSKVEVKQGKNKLMRFNRNRPQPTLTSSRPNDSYDSRLDAVRRKRELNEKMFIEQTLRKVENRSFQFRMARRCEGEEQRQRMRECFSIKVSLQKMLIKQFLVRLLTRPVGEGREVKIASFARYLKLERLEKRIRGLFIRTRVRFNMRRLHQSQVFRFFLLTMTFQQYVKRFRVRKATQLRKMVVGELFKGVIRQKLKIGLTACHFNVRKLQKFREWLALVRGERRRCLKSIWKVQLLSLMRLNSDNESSAICYVPRNPQQLTFEAIYQEQVTLNPLLKLTNFLNHHSIFRIKTTIFQQLFVLSRQQRKDRKQKIGKVVKAFGRSRRFRIKFSEEEEEKQDRLNLLQTDIYPYSSHYNILIHPKNYDITIPEIMKVSDRWSKEERKILDRHIDFIITAHEQRLLDLRRSYDRELATFIAHHYDSLSEKRWKYILEYNQLDHTAPIAKKEREIRRLMRLIGAQKMLDNDCIPEKQAILDEVFRRPDAPQPPNSNIVFGPLEFKKLFRAYYEAVSAKAKQVRRNFL